jgi:ComF family protein
MRLLPLRTVLPWWQRLVARLGPGSQCLICRQWQGRSLCDACLSTFAPACLRCRYCAIELPAGADEICPDCLRAPPPCSRAVAALTYGHPWDQLVLGLKFGDRPELANPLAALLAAEVERAMRCDALPPPDWLLPVPLADERLRERGYNQAWEIGRRVARRLELPARPDLLWRVRATPHQLALPRAARQTNVHGAFACHPQARQQLAGTSVALVDDVMTTGATLDEVTRTLLRAGVADVQVWVVARTP